MRVRPDGARRLYSLRPEPFRDLDAWLSATGVFGRAGLTGSGSELARRQERRPRDRGSKGDRHDQSDDRRRPARRITMERTFAAPMEDVWELWTTKEGIESWWGPEGFTQ